MTAEDDARFRAKARPIAYLIAVLLVLVGSFAFKMRRDGIFACPANGYDDDYYLGYCHGTAYGDYDHGAFWFELEPEISTYASSADVLFLGSSRLQYGFSSDALSRWFAEINRTYYLMGFTHTENVNFYAPLLKRLRPQARAYVINADQFFVNRESPPAHDVMHEPGAREKYKQKRYWQIPHRVVCTVLSALCGGASSFFRNRETGEWRLGGVSGKVASDVGPVRPIDIERVAHEQFNAAQFIRNLGVKRDCIFFTYVPPKENERATAAAIASAIGFELISPKVEGLRTFDGSHLQRASAERFASAFLELAGPRLRKCLSDERPPNLQGILSEDGRGSARIAP